MFDMQAMTNFSDQDTDTAMQNNKQMSATICVVPTFSTTATFL